MAKRGGGGFYLLQQRHRWLPEENVEAGDEAEPARKRRVERHRLGSRRNVEGCLEVQVALVVASHQETLGTGRRRRRRRGGDKRLWGAAF